MLNILKDNDSNEKNKILEILYIFLTNLFHTWNNSINVELILI